MLFMNRLEFSCFADFLLRFLKPKKRMKGATKSKKDSFKKIFNFNLDEKF